MVSTGTFAAMRQCQCSLPSASFYFVLFLVLGFLRAYESEDCMLNALAISWGKTPQAWPWLEGLLPVVAWPFSFAPPLEKFSCVELARVGKPR